MHNILSMIFKTVLLPIIFVLVCSSCSRTRNNPVQGGQDSGGGNVTASNLVDVEFYYKKAVAQLPYILEVFFKVKTIQNFTNLEKRKLFFSVVDKLMSLDKAPSPKLERAVGILLKSSKINIEKTKSCRSKDKEHSYASIKDFNIGSPICISFHELSKLPPSSLEREIISLLLHEYLHALNIDETNIVVIQESLTYNFDKIFLHGIKTFTQREKYKGHTRINFYVDTLSSYLEKSQNITQKDWENFCSTSDAISLIIQSDMDWNLSIFGKLTPQLIHSGETTEIEVEKYLNTLDRYQSRIENNLMRNKILCSWTTKHSLTEEEAKFVNILIEDIAGFYDLQEAQLKSLERYK